MTLNDILLHIDTYPDASPPEAIDQAVGFAAALGGRLSAIAVQVRFPLHSNRIADYLIGLSRLAHVEEAKSLDAARAGLDRFTAQAQAAGVFGEALVDHAEFYAVAEQVTKRARTRDLCLIPLAAPFNGQVDVAQSAIFGSGRPVLLYKTGQADLPAGSLATVVVAWDGSRSAARALADALPILQRAKAVRVLTVVDEKPAAVAGLAQEAARHLAAHGVAAAVDEQSAQGRSIGAALDAYVQATGPDLLVMGAYGHSRLREFVLGGATEHVVADPKTPVLLSH